MGRLSNNDERREQIVTAFMKVVSRKGYSKSSIHEIATEANITPGLIHYHFKSKQEILMTLFLRLENIVKKRLDSRIKKLTLASRPEENLYALIDAFLELDNTTDQLAVHCWTVISSEAMVNVGLKRAYSQTLERQLDELEVAIKMALPSKKVSKKKLRGIGSAILASIHGHFLLASISPGLIPEGSAAASVRHMTAGILASM